MTSSKPKILLVDDIRENLIALGALIRSDDLDIHTAESGEAALEMLLKHEFALALLDVQMPAMNGFELAEMMRGSPKSRHIPIIFVTAGGREKQYQFKGYESGAVDFLYKPLDELMVRSKVRIFVDLYRQRSQLAQQNAELQQARHEQEVLVEKLLETQRRLEQAMHAREEFLSMAALELKTPLTSMLIQVQARRRNLKRGEVENSKQNIHNMLSTNEQELEQVIRLVDDMLDVSRVRLGKLPLRRKLVDLGELAKNVAGAMSQRFELIGAGVHIVCEQPVVGDWDPFRIEQVLINLLDNVLLHAPGSPVDIGIEQNGSMAVVRISDRGAGIAPADQERIFGQFETVKPFGKNTGVGLYVSRKIAESHGGTINVESQPGKGATFILELPLEAETAAATLP